MNSNRFSGCGTALNPVGCGAGGGRWVLSGGDEKVTNGRVIACWRGWNKGRFVAVEREVPGVSFWRQLWRRCVLRRRFSAERVEAFRQSERDGTASAYRGPD